MTYFSTFSGIGGFELGIQQAYENSHQRTTKRIPGGHNLRDGRDSTDTSGTGSEQQWRKPTCIGFSEIDKYANQIYAKHFPEHKPYGNIRDISTDTLPDFDLLCGGFPCQAFSIAGKRGGFDDTRGTLFFELARIARVKRPRLLFFENVKGLLSHDGGRTFDTIIRTIDELGYDIQWQVLNSKNFGVPQNRERVFIIGHLRGTPRPQVFPFGQNNQEAVELSGHHANTLTARYQPAEATGTYIDEGQLNAQIRQLNQPTHSNNRLYGTDGIAPTLNTAQGRNRQPKIVASRGRNPANPSDRTTGAPTEQRLEINETGTSNTLTSVEKDNWVLENSKIRRLTPVECERLQGFPDNWTECVSDTQRYKTLGNAVSVPVIEYIAKKLLM